MRLRVALFLCLAACEQRTSAPAHAPAPVYVEHAVAESELAVVRFTPDALRRLGIQTASVQRAQQPDTRLVGGEVIVPPGRSVSVVAPVGGMVQAVATTASVLTPGSVVRRGDLLLRLVPLAPVDRDLRARAAREVAVARAQLSAAQARLDRLIRLQAEEASSQRLVEEATSVRDIARADLLAAETRAKSMEGTALLADVALTVRAPDTGVVRSLSAMTGQVVAAGAPLLEIAAVDALQIRVPVYGGDLGRLELRAPARVRGLGADVTQAIEARPVAGPPTADPLAATVDRYFALGGGPALFSPGERVLVELPLRTRQDELSVPAGSVVYDAQGAGWIYACQQGGAFRRERIDPLRQQGAQLVFARGPALGACVASVGVSEIFGSEFPPGH